MLLLTLTKDFKRASASYLALWATSMVDCVVLRFIEAWHCPHGTSISPQSLVTGVSTSFNATSWLQLLQVAFTFPSNCWTKMLRQLKPSLGCLQIWQFFTPFFTSWSAQCPQTGWPHGLAICGSTIGYVLKWIACSRRSDSRAREKNSRRKKEKKQQQLNSLPTYRRALLSERLEQAMKWKESMSSVRRNLCPRNNQSKEFYFSYQISQINSFGTLLTSTFLNNCWDNMYGRLSQVYHVRVMI